MPFLKLAAVHDTAAGSLTLFALNRHLEEELPLEVDAAGFAGLAVGQALELRDDDLEAVNPRTTRSGSSPRRSTGVALAGARLRATLAPASWNVIRLIPRA